MGHKQLLPPPVAGFSTWDSTRASRIAECTVWTQTKRPEIMSFALPTVKIFLSHLKQKNTCSTCNIENSRHQFSLRQNQTIFVYINIVEKVTAMEVTPREIFGCLTVHT
jgi:hypothetical protein